MDFLISFPEILLQAFVMRKVTLISCMQTLKRSPLLIRFLIYVIFYKKVELHKYHKTTIFFKKFATLYFREDILKYPIVSALHLGPSFNSCFFPKESVTLYESYGYFKQALYSYKVVNCFWQGNITSFSVLRTPLFCFSWYFHASSWSKFLNI